MGNHLNEFDQFRVNESEHLAYATSGNGSAPYFDEKGHLVIQPATDAERDMLLAVRKDATTLNVGIQLAAHEGGLPDIVLGAGDPAPAGNDGFIYLPATGGVPTGTPTAYGRGIPTIVDSNSGTLYFYKSGAWEPVSGSAGAHNNVGSGAEVFKENAGGSTSLRSFVGLGGITVTQQVDTIEISGSTLDHGALNGLGDDDHPHYQLRSEKGAANGYAGLDAGGKVPTAQLPQVVFTEVHVVADIPARDALSVQEGDVAKVLDDGTGEANTYIYDGAGWVELSVNDAVDSVNGFTGSVSLDTDDIPEGTNLYYTDERVDDRVANLLVAGNDISLTYDDGAGTLTIDVATGIDAGTLDGLDSTQFLRSDVSDTFTGSQLAISSANDVPLRVESTDGFVGIQLTDPTASMYLGYSGDVFRIRTAAGSVDVVEIDLGAPANSLDIIGTGQVQLNVQGSSGGLLIGGDTNLYRSAANVLKTDDAFEAASFSGDGSALTNVDAETFDGLDSQAFLRSNATDTATSLIKFSRAGAADLVHFEDATTSNRVSVRITAGGSVNFVPGPGGVDDFGKEFLYNFNNNRWQFDASPYVGTNRILDTSDEGAGNGLDADTVDGLDSSQFLRSDADDHTTGKLGVGALPHSAHKFVVDGGISAISDSGSASGPASVSGSATLVFRDPSNNQDVEIAHDPFDVSLPAGGWGIRVRRAADTNTDTGNKAQFIVEGNIYADNDKTVWHQGNDGSGSGLDADLLDGREGSQYAFREQNTVTVTAPGWHRIAKNGPVTDGGTGGDRATGKFVVTNTESGLHQAIHFYASVHFGQDPTLTLLSNSKYTSGDLITDLRVVEGDTYEGAAVEIYVAASGTRTFNVDLYEDDTSLGWTLTDEAGSTPTGFAATQLVIDEQLFGLAADGDEQFRINRSGLVRASAGSAASPTYSFHDDADTGMYRSGADRLGFSANGVERVTIDTSLTRSLQTVQVENSAPTLIFKDIDSTGNAQLGYISFQDNGAVERAWLGFGTTSNDDLSLQNNYAGGHVTLTPGSGGEARVGSSRILTVADEGAGNGLDADTVDGIQAASFLRSDAADTSTAIITFTSTATPRYNVHPTFSNDLELVDKKYVDDNITAASDPLTVKESDGTPTVGNVSTLEFDQAANFVVTSPSANTAKVSLSQGAGSGLDADLLDGVQGSSYLRSDAADTSTAPITLNGGDSLRFTSSGLRIANVSGTAHTWIPYSDGGIYLTTDGTTGGGKDEVTIRHFDGASYVGGKIVPQATAGSSVGTATTKWADVYATNVHTGDLVMHDPICVCCGEDFGEDDDLYMRVVKVEGPEDDRALRTVPIHADCKGLPVKHYSPPT